MLFQSSNRSREIVLLSVIGGYSSKEVGKIVGRKDSTVRSVLSRSLEKLREFMANKNGYKQIKRSGRIAGLPFRRMKNKLSGVKKQKITMFLNQYPLSVPLLCLSADTSLDTIELSNKNRQRQYSNKSTSGCYSRLSRRYQDF